MKENLYLKNLKPGAELNLRDGRTVTFQHYGDRGELFCRGHEGPDDIHGWQPDGRWGEYDDPDFVSDADIVDVIVTLF